MIRQRMKRNWIWGLAVALACALGAITESTEALRRRGKLSHKARIEAGLRGAGKMDVMVRFRRQPGAAERNLVRSFEGRQRHAARSRWMSVRLPARHVSRFADDPNVEFVAIDAPMTASMDVARQTAGMPPAETIESGLTGAGVTIAVVDSGVAQHPEIGTLVAAVDFTVPEFTDPNLPPPLDPYAPETSVDLYGHGTHVAGIMVGNGSQSAGTHKGLAPGANLVSVRVLGDTGSGQASDVLAGLEWIAANKDLYGILVVNMSLGHPIYETAENDPLVQAVESLWDAGVTVVCSAGNAGRSGDGTVMSPCNSRKIITVGAMNDHNTTDGTDDAIATYSSRGPTGGDLFAKPDLVAPGNKIVSLRSAGSVIDTMFPERRVAADPAQPGVYQHIEMSGTSMAAPMVAATAALMLEQEPLLNPGSIKARLMLSARKATVGNPFASGAGVLDVLGALRTTGIVADAPSPKVVVDGLLGRVGVENTAVLWGDPMFSTDATWAGSVVYADGTQWSDPVVWTVGVRWSDGDTAESLLLWPDAEMWPYAEFWPMTVLWGESVLWPNAELWPMAELWPCGLLTPDE
jgi:serine protease AprX